MVSIVGTPLLAAAQQQASTASAGSVYPAAPVVQYPAESTVLAVRNADVDASPDNHTASAVSELPDAPALGMGAPTPVPVPESPLTSNRSDQPVVSQGSDWFLHRAAIAVQPSDEGSVSSTFYSDASVYPFRSSSGPFSSSAGSSTSSTASARGVDILPVGTSPVELKDCPYDKTHSSVCRLHWRQLTITSSVFLAFQNVGNLYTGYWYRQETTHGKWWDRYVNSVEGWRWNVWKDDNPFLDDYIGHPMMGGITDAFWIQNDPKGMTLEQSNTWPYWRSRLRAMAFSTFYSFEWKLGPIGEASVGHNGDHYFNEDNGVYTNETGWVELVTTPVGGLVWTLAEDAIDKKVIRRLEQKSSNPAMLIAYQFLNPSRAFANFLRFRTPWYRDSREVRANSFWSDPEDNSPSAAPAVTAAASTSDSSAIPSSPASASSSSIVPVQVATQQAKPSKQPFTLPGGVHEFGAVWGLSLHSGHVWGSASDIKYMPVLVRYSYLLGMHNQMAFRYAPELTALAMLDQPNPGQKDQRYQRKRIYGSGFSPIGFQTDFFPRHRVQPFLSTNGGFVYFVDHVLSPQGSQWMYTVDFGGGINIFRKERQAVTLGYRYQHLDNGNISLHNPGTDANTFYLGISRFRTKGSK